MRIKMRRQYGKLLPGKEYNVDSTTGGTLIERRLADEASRRPRGRRRKKR